MIYFRLKITYIKLGNRKKMPKWPYRLCLLVLQYNVGLIHLYCPLIGELFYESSGFYILIVTLH